MNDKMYQKKLKKLVKSNKKEKLNTPWYTFYDNVPATLEYPKYSIYDHLVEAATKYPNYYAYNYFGQKQTFFNFIKEINHCAKSLKTLGIKAKDTVTICMPNTPEAVIMFYAINQIGAVSSMIHPLSAEQEIKKYLEISNSVMLVTLDVFWGKVAPIIDETNVRNTIILSAKTSMPIILKTGFMITKEYKIKKPVFNESVISWEKFIKMGETYLPTIKPNIKANDLAVILYSGGTTGDPKGVMLSNYNFNALALQCYDMCQNIHPGDSILAVLPVFHGFGLGVAIHTVLSLGGCSILVPQFTPQTFEKLITKYRPNVIAGVPTLFEALMQNNKNKKLDLSHLKIIISGGDSLSGGMKVKIDKFLKAHNCDVSVRQGYGLAECIAASCLMPLNHYREMSIGIPLPDMYYRIVAPNTNTELKYGETGEICISGPTVMLGYLNDDIETNKALYKDKNGRIWLHTGDLGYMDEDGFVYFKQRLKRMIVSSGYNIYPQHIENVLDSHPDVLMSTVIGIDHPYKGQVAKAFIVLNAGVKPSNKIEKELKEYCNKNLARFSIPKEFEFRESLPKTIIGKVAYRELEEEEKNKK